MGEMVFGAEVSRLLSDSGAGAMVLDQEGRVLYFNDVAARVFAKRPPAECKGLRLGDLLRPHAAEERIDAARRVIAGGQPVQFVELWSGVAMRATVRRLDAFGPSQAPASLWVYAPENALLDLSTRDDLGVPLIEARHVDLGPLAGLTASELKVLALLGEGLSNADIAARLHRAVKTVESHRAALTEKTGNSSRVELGIMARRAGLIRRLDLPPVGSEVKASAVPSFG